MSNTFEILSRFLERYGDEVEGHGLDEMPPEVETKLRAFARGKLAPAQRSELARLLKDNPRWISLLAEEVKAGRGTSRA